MLKKTVWPQSQPAKLSIPRDLRALTLVPGSAPRAQIPEGTYRIVSTCGTKALAKRYKSPLVPMRKQKRPLVGKAFKV